jgi:hypothetical protein
MGQHLFLNIISSNFTGWDRTESLVWSGHKSLHRNGNNGLPFPSTFTFWNLESTQTHRVLFPYSYWPPRLYTIGPPTQAIFCEIFVGFYPLFPIKSRLPNFLIQAVDVSGEWESNSSFIAPSPSTCMPQLWNVPGAWLYIPTLSKCCGSKNKSMYN